MRSVELVKVAAAAEALLLRRIARRQVFRVAYGAGAAVFGVAVLVMLHMLVFIGLLYLMVPILAALVVFVLDLIAAGVLASMALKSTPDSVEREAVVVRDQAIFELKRSATVMAMTAEVAGAVFRRRAKTGMRRGAASVLAELATRAIGR